MNKERQSGFKIMLRLIKVLKPLAPIMMITISFGILGFNVGMSASTAIKIVIACAILRGILRFIEQYSGHFIAFTILAINYTHV